MSVYVEAQKGFVVTFFVFVFLFVLLAGFLEKYFLLFDLFLPKAGLISIRITSKDILANIFVRLLLIVIQDAFCP